MIHRERRAFTMIEIAVLLALLAIVVVATMPMYQRGRGRSRVGRVQGDQRSMATALNAYYIDNNAYPLAIAQGDSRRRVANSLVAGAAVELPADAFAATPGSSRGKERDSQIVTFAVSGSSPGTLGGFFSLTTPISYITSYFNDPFSPGGQSTFTYLPDRSGFILVSDSPSPRLVGGSMAPTGLAAALREQFVASKPGAPFDGADRTKSLHLIRWGAYKDGYAYAYDPTNGSVSKGALFRMQDDADPTPRP